MTAEAAQSCTSDAGEQMVQFWSEYKGLRTRRADGVSSSPKVSGLKSQEEADVQLDLKVGTDRCASLKVGRQKVLLLCLFVLCKTSTDWTRPTHFRENNLLYSVCQFGC